jgi:hypothetical protein
VDEITSRDSVELSTRKGFFSQALHGPQRRFHLCHIVIVRLPLCQSSLRIRFFGCANRKVTNLLDRVMLMIFNCKFVDE